MPVCAVGCGPGVDQGSHGLPSPSAPSIRSNRTWSRPSIHLA